jgi:NitT/TauT family transport system substrate-binding protein
MNRRVRGMAVVAAVAAVSLLSGGCSGVKGPAFTPVEKHDLIVGAVPVADSAALYIAEQRHLFAASGLHVKIVPVTSGATAIAGQLAGHYDVVLGNYVSYILAEAQHGYKFRILAPGSAEGPDDSVLLAPPGSPIQSISDLKGKTIGVNSLNNIGTLLVTSLLADYAMGTKLDHIRFKAIPFPDLTHALVTHQVDAAWLVEPFVTYAGMGGAQELADTDAGSTQNLPIAGYMVTQSWEQKYPGTAAAFQHALLEGQEIAANDSTAVYQSLKEFANIPASVADITALPGYPLSNDPLSLQRIPDLMLDFGMLDHSFNISRMLRP